MRKFTFTRYVIKDDNYSWQQVCNKDVSVAIFVMICHVCNPCLRVRLLPVSLIRFARYGQFDGVVKK